MNILHKQPHKKTKSIIPGFKLSFGITIAMLSLIVLIPICSLAVYTSELSFSEFIETVTRPRVLASYKVSLTTALIASLINAVMGLIIAWVLVRYDFSFKRIMDGVFIAGNTPYETEIVPLMIMSELQEFDYPGATSLALVMLLASFVILFINAIVQSRNARIVNNID